MDQMLPTTLGKLRILCALPLFSDAICHRTPSAAEHAFTTVLLTIAITSRLGMAPDQMCEAIELAIFGELPKAYLGDPSFYLRQRHPEAEEMYSQVRGRIWRETESATGLRTTRDPQLVGLHALLDSFAARLFIERESLLGNGYFAAERSRTHYHRLKEDVAAGQSLSAAHPAESMRSASFLHPFEHGHAAEEESRFYQQVVADLEALFDDAHHALQTEGIGAFSATFIGMLEKLKLHFRYKGWSFHYKESVGEHTYQVVFICRLLAEELGLDVQTRIDLYRAAALHDLAEAYASDVVYPVKVREHDLGEMHATIEKRILQRICGDLGFDLPTDERVWAFVDIADRFSAQIYFDRERRSGNSHFNVPNASMDKVKAQHGNSYPEAFALLERLWSEFSASLESKPG
jgi:5'-deoxynucleotidase YfbR-like HD superfamily hydrolase